MWPATDNRCPVRLPGRRVDGHWDDIVASQERSGKEGFRVTVEAVRRADLFNNPTVEQNHPVSNRKRLHLIVRDEQGT